MRIRTQLILASFVLAVLPLAGIVVWSYHSSREALEAARRREAARMTRQMDKRLASIRAEIDQRLAVVSALPIEVASNQTQADDRAMVGGIVTAMGDVASLVDSLEYQPVPVPRPPAPVASARPAARPVTAAPAIAQADPDPDFDFDVDVDPEPAEEPRQAGEAKATRFVVHPSINVDPIVINIPSHPEIPRYIMPQQQRELITRITTLATTLHQAQGLTPEQRDEMKKELAAAQRELDEAMASVRVEVQRRNQDALNRSAADREIIRRAREHRDAQRRAAARGSGASVGPGPSPVPGVPVAPAPPLPQIAGGTPNAQGTDAGGPAAGTSAGGAAQGTPATTPAPAPAPVDTKAERKADKKKDLVRPKTTLTAAEKEKVKSAEKRSALILGQKFNVPVTKEGEVIGQLSARVRTEEVVRRVLGTATDDSDELPFAIDREGNVYTRTSEERARLDDLGIPKLVREGKSIKNIEGWIVTDTTDKASGLRIGVARPVGENLDALRRTAGRNFVLGLGLIVFAVIGIVPLANHLTRDVKLVTEGAQRIAHGDLMTRLPVQSKNEFGQLSVAFNRMAEDLSLQQQKLLEQERARKEQELQQRLMAVEYDRKTFELEEARRFQLSMLPKEVPRHERYDVAVYTRTATEVGGDYYDFHIGADNALAVTIGDATGHGAKAGTMVTVVKTLFAGYGSKTTPADFLGDAAERIKRMELGRMSMALSLARFDGHRLTLASAGMPPVLIHRAASGTIDEIAIEATPLGTLGIEYKQENLKLHAGDTVLFMTDGFPELLNDAGQQLGYVTSSEAFATAALAPNADGVIRSLTDTVRAFHGDQPPNDDVTFVVVRVA